MPRPKKPALIDTRERALAVELPEWATHVAVAWEHDRADPVRLTGGIFGRAHYDQHGLTCYAVNSWEFHSRAELHKHRERQVLTGEGLRHVRLWHWGQCLLAEARGDRPAYSFHMKAVQALNDHFEVDDTVATDLAKAEKQPKLWRRMSVQEPVSRCDWRGE